MGYRALTTLHLIGLFAIFFINVACYFAVLKRIQDKPFLHWYDIYERQTNNVYLFSALFNFKMARLLYSRFKGKKYFDVACEERFEQLIKPMFVLTMISLLQMAPIALVNIYTIWLLRWGYQIVTLSIEAIVLALVILALEIYEFVLHKSAEPEYMGVRDYFAKDPYAK